MAHAPVHSRHPTRPAGAAEVSNDIVDRLRHWSHGLTYDPAIGLMHEAATEIERLRTENAEMREALREMLQGIFAAPDAVDA